MCVGGGGLGTSKSQNLMLIYQVILGFAKIILRWQNMFYKRGEVISYQLNHLKVIKFIIIVEIILDCSVSLEM